TIQPLSALPALTASVTIDATTQSGFTGTPFIELDGSGAGSADGLIVTGSNCTVRGFVINRFGGSGTQLKAGASSDAILGNYLGTNVAGTTALGNAGSGIALFNIATNNTIGGIATGDGNLISGNLGIGIFIDGSGGAASGNVIKGNLIGTDA